MFEYEDIAMHVLKLEQSYILENVGKHILKVEVGPEYRHRMFSFHILDLHSISSTIYGLLSIARIDSWAQNQEKS